MATWRCIDCGTGPLYDLSCVVVKKTRPVKCIHHMKDEDGKAVKPFFIYESD